MNKQPILVLLLSFLLISSYSYAQKEKEISAEEVKRIYKSLPKVDNKVEYTEVVQLDSSFKKEILYKNSKLFFTNAFKSAKDVIQYDDREEGKVIGKGNFLIEGSQATFLILVTEKWRVFFSLEIFSKDGKYRYRLYDFYIESRRVASGGSSPDNVSNTDLDFDQAYLYTEKGVTKKMNKKMFVEIVENINSTINGLKAQMSKKESGPSSDF